MCASVRVRGVALARNAAHFPYIAADRVTCMQKHVQYAAMSNQSRCTVTKAEEVSSITHMLGLDDTQQPT